MNRKSQQDMDSDPYRDQLAEENSRLRRELAKAKQGATNQGFVQVSRKYLDDLDDLGFRSKAARKLLTNLVKAMNRQNAVMVSQGSLAKLTGLSTPTVKRAIALLREEQWIEVLKVGTSNVYRVNSSVFWTARADGRWASFSAEILVNYDEQDEFTKEQATNPPKTSLRHIPVLSAQEDVVVTGTELGSEDPPEQAQIDFHGQAQ
ncbi:replication/maintenance protein RepL [Stutzerimonas nitrititolerans]|uniref:replication/maintenance protein RepL n=1 Tax=Stutzerimonas nitrititolerans TaxID=2482751 RepID=UPI0028A698B4|nr:replication/maintenance protein RepL [Stutzerimonas nitrititolerans]